MPDPVLALDLGTSTLKCALYAGRGAAPRHARAARATGGTDPADLLAAVRALVVEVLDGAPAPRRLALTGQMGSHVWADPDGRPRGPIVSWTDRRDAGAGQALLDALDGPGGLGLAAYHRISGQRGPGLAARTAWGHAQGFVGAPVPLRQWVLHAATGSWCVDPTDASVTGLLDIARTTWSEALCAALPVEKPSLLPIRGASETVGQVSAAGERRLGVPAGTEVIAGAGDGPCASLGAGAEGSIACLTLASSGTLRLLVDEPVADPSRSATCLAFRPRDYVLSLPVSNVGSALEWARGTLGFATVADLTDAAESAPIDPALTFLPYLTGERFPYWDRRRTAGFHGLTERHGRAETARAVLDAVAFSLRRCLDHARGLGVVPRAIHVGGGAARSGALVRLLAALLDLPLYAVAGEALEGAAVLASGSSPHPVPFPGGEPEPIRPASIDSQLADAAYQRFLELSDAAPGGWTAS